jgi:hypothetical protein
VNRPAPLAPGERLRSVGLVSIPAGADRELLYNEHSGAARLLTYEDGDILSLCRVFRTVDGHAREICRAAGLPDANLPAITSQVSLLARSGLLVRRSELMERLSAPSPPPADPVHVAPAGARLNDVLREFRGRRVILGDAPARGAAAGPPAFISAPYPTREGRPEGPALDAAAVLGAAPGDVAGPDVDLDTLDAVFLRRLRRGGGVIAATQRGTTARHVDRLLVTNQPYALDGPLGLDNRLPLPPAPEIDAGAREVFLLVVRKVIDRSLIALLPGAVEGPAPAPRAGTRMADLFLALIGPFEIGPARADGAARRLALAAHLRSVASLSAEEFARLSRPLLRAIAPPAALLAPRIETPVDVPDPRAAILAYAELLEGWPA